MSLNSVLKKSCWKTRHRYSVLEKPVRMLHAGKFSTDTPCWKYHAGEIGTDTPYRKYHAGKIMPENPHTGTQYWKNHAGGIHNVTANAGTTRNAMHPMKKPHCCLTKPPIARLGNITQMPSNNRTQRQRVRNSWRSVLYPTKSRRKSGNCQILL